MSRPVKFLCLPGYLQNGRIFAEKSSGIRKMLTKQLSYELDYVKPPVVIDTKEDLPFILSDNNDEAESKWGEIVSKEVNCCWWHAGEKNMYDGLEDSFTFIKDYIEKNGPFDGIIGFSQGAAMAAAVANTITELVPSHGPFKVALLFSGFVFTQPIGNANALNHVATEDLEEYKKNVIIRPEFQKIFTPTGATKIINVFGSADMTVPAIRSEYLASLYDPLRVKNFKHDGGHFLPNKKPFLTPIVAEIKLAIEDEDKGKSSL